MNNTKNLCAQIPVELHQRVRAEQEASGKSLSQYITELLTEYYEGGNKTMENMEEKTLAFKIPVGMFEELKAYLKKHNLKQKDFVLGLIEQALAEERDN